MMKRLALAAAAAAMVCSASAAGAETPEEKLARKEEEKRLGSLYLRCDGNPNNMSDGENFARILGAVTLLGIFAKSPEAPDASKRLFGQAGVDACTQLIDGEKAETNGLRRIPLILARSLHRIEAKDYRVALDDVAKARDEAKTLGLVGNPYFDRSMGLSFDNIEAEALLRLDDVAGAQKASVRRTEGLAFSYVPLVTARTYLEFRRESEPETELVLNRLQRFQPESFFSYARVLEEQGRFAEAASKFEEVLKALDELKPEEANSGLYAQTALSHALAGNWERARERAEFARNNIVDRRNRGVPEDNSSRTVELLDLHDILQLAHDGNIVQARRSFAARSQWLEPSLGAVMEANRILREGAPAEELTGMLAHTPDELWKERRDAAMAVKLQKDTDKDTLFTLIWPYAKIGEFEGRSKDTWRIAKSKMMSSKPDEDTGLWRIGAFGNRQVTIDSIVLHSALQAKAAGKQGFTMMLSLSDIKSYYGSLTFAFVRFVDPDEPGVSAERYIAADDAIAELRQVIPSPDEIKARKKQKKV
ncbi:hypothetical protein [Altererythrobacter fulvus]|uniref:hypothetical protein n=1 Tax=Caenibius fulvus TaxID=2126012 RepID=UPI0030185CFA